MVDNEEDCIELGWPLSTPKTQHHFLDEDETEHHCSIHKETKDPVADVSLLYQEQEGKSSSDNEDSTSISKTLLGQVSEHFNNIDSTFTNQYMHKCQYDEIGLGKNE